MHALDDRVDEFHRLHASGCFVMPNPWDVGSAQAPGGAGLPGARHDERRLRLDAGARGHPGHPRPDARASPAHRRGGVRAGQRRLRGRLRGRPAGVAANVTLAADTGIAGLSIEDSSGDAADPLFDFDLAVARIAAARRAIDESGTRLVLTARSEGFVHGRPDIDETICRLRAYAEAGADCLYAPRIESLEHVSAIVAAVAPKPVNLLINAPFTTVAQAAQLGVRRISVGGTLARTAWDGFLIAAREIADAGTFSRFERLPDVDALLGG